jgi:hypothetical protein
MKATLVRGAIMTSALLLAAWNAVPAAAQQPQAGIEVLSRGPVHEAYAQPFAMDPTPTPPVPQAPPTPVAETPPDNKPDGPGVQWVSGYWSWDDERRDFTWVSGFWRAPPPGREWHAGQWVQDGNGYRWVHGYWDAADPGRAAQTLTQPPPDSLEQGASSPAPDENSIYVPGGWVAANSGYNWRPGYWTAGSEDWVWCPDQYYWTPTGCCYVPGYWDYPVAYRGELFAPVAFTTAAYTDPGFTYCPSYVVGYGGLLHSLFIRPGYGSYYFGDYYSRNYYAAGYYPWFSYGSGHRHYDPLWTYHNWYYPRNGYSNWSRQYHGHYDARVRGDSPRPPRTFVQSTAQVRTAAPQIVTPASPARRHVGPPRVTSNVQIPAVASPRASTSQFRGHGDRPDSKSLQQVPPRQDVILPRVVNIAPPQNRPAAATSPNVGASTRPPSLPAPQVQFRQAPTAGGPSVRPGQNLGGRPMPNVGGRPNPGGGRPMTGGGGNVSGGHAAGRSTPNISSGRPMPKTGGGRPAPGGGHSNGQAGGRPAAGPHNGRGQHR